MQPQNEMINLTIDDQPIQVPKGTTVYKAAEKMGVEIPIFCYQDRMPPFGACRMCLVEVDNMPKLQASCTLEAREGMVVRTESSRTKEGRERVLELLLLQHPLDCPVCDKGGECPLQDNTFKWGPARSRFYEDKRDFVKPINLGPVLTLDRERCIVCARCTRFSDLISGDHALEFIDRGFRTEVGTPGEGPVESKFIGNTIMICPVGALTSEVYRFKARPWDNASTNSTCTLCPVGCSNIIDERDGKIVRTRSCENRNVNDIWLCDKGWFGYEFPQSQERLKTPLIRRNGNLEAASWDEAFELIATKFKESTKEKIAGFGGNPLTVEENFLFQKLIKQFSNNVDHRIGMPIQRTDEEGLSAGMEISIGELEDLNYAILLGTDITEEFPLLWLRLKQSINRGAKVIFLGNYAPEIAQHLSEIVLHAPGKELEVIQQNLSKIQGLSGKGALLVGRQYLANENRSAIISELHKVKQSKPDLSLNLLEGRSNSIGARFAGMRPDLLSQGGRPSKPGLNALEVVEASAQSGWDLLLVAGADPATKFPSKLWNDARAKLKFLIVQDLFLTETAKQADVVLPTLCAFEKRGAFINIEGRIQYMQPGKNIPEDVLSDAEIFTNIASKLNINLVLDDAFIKTVSQDRIKIQSELAESHKPVTTKTGGLLATLAHALFDNGNRMKHNPHLIQLAKEPYVRISKEEGLKRKLQTGDSIKVKANGNSVTGKVKLDERVAAGTAVLPLGFDEFRVQELTKDYMNGFEIEIES